jgi:hypothetical protein
MSIYGQLSKPVESQSQLQTIQEGHVQQLSDTDNYSNAKWFIEKSILEEHSITSI